MRVLKSARDGIAVESHLRPVSRPRDGGRAEVLFPGVRRCFEKGKQAMADDRGLRDRKARLRVEVREGIAALDAGRRADEEGALQECFPKLEGYDAARTVLLYVKAFPEEIDTGPLLRAALDGGKRLICPRVDRKARGLRLHEIRDLARDLAPGALGIPEPRPDSTVIDPREIDWALIPGLAFDRRGFRVGRGAGYYDRLLPTLRPDVLCWALILSPQWFDRVPSAAHDQPVDGIVGMGGILRFQPGERRGASADAARPPD